MSNRASQETAHQAITELLNPPTIITQAMLEEYERLRRSESARRRLRRTILHLLDTDAPIEPGERVVQVSEVDNRIFSRDKLNAVLGEERVDELLELIEPTTFRYLSVEHSRGCRRPDGSLMTLAEYYMAQAQSGRSP